MRSQNLHYKIKGRESDSYERSIEVMKYLEQSERKVRSFFVSAVA